VTVPIVNSQKVTWNGNGTVASWSFTPTAGNRLLLFYAKRNLTEAPNPTGWSVVSYSGQKEGVIEKVSAGTETSVTFANSGVGPKFSGFVFEMSDVGSIHAAAWVAHTFTFPFEGAADTVVAAGSRVFGYCVRHQDTGSPLVFSVEGGYTGHFTDSADSSGPQTFVQSIDNVAAGSHQPTTSTGDNWDWSAITVVAEYDAPAAPTGRSFVAAAIG